MIWFLLMVAMNMMLFTMIFKLLWKIYFKSQQNPSFRKAAKTPCETANVNTNLHSFVYFVCRGPLWAFCLVCEICYGMTCAGPTAWFRSFLWDKGHFWILRKVVEKQSIEVSGNALYLLKMKENGLDGGTPKNVHLLKKHKGNADSCKKIDAMKNIYSYLHGKNEIKPTSVYFVAPRFTVTKQRKYTKMYIFERFIS